MSNDDHSEPNQAPRIFYTDLNSVRVSVYAEYQCEQERALYWEQGWRIEGDIYGPHCSLSDTLPARIPFKDRGAGKSLMSAAVLPDPCPWSATLPATYLVTTQVTNGSDHGSSHEQLLAFKSLDTANRDFVQTDLNGFTKRWVLRASAGTVAESLTDEGDECRELRLSRVVTNPTIHDCQEATKHGLWLVVFIDRPASAVSSALAELSQWPCIACCVLPNDLDLQSNALPNNLLLAAIVPALDSRASWAQIVLTDARDVATCHEQNHSATVPVIACDVASYHNDRKAREQCARLQAKLAPQGDYAGYIVSQDSLFPN